MKTVWPIARGIALSLALLALLSLGAFVVVELTGAQEEHEIAARSALASGE
jgi:hypothetical protein